MHNEDFLRIMMTEQKTRQLIEKRLLMKNVVRNARVTSIAAQFDKQQLREQINQSPRRGDTTRNVNLQNIKKQNFEEEYKYYRTQAEQMLIKQEEEKNKINDIENKKQHQNQKYDDKQTNSPKILAKKKVQKDILIKGFQEQLKLNMVKKFNTLQLERLQNYIPENMIENIDTTEGEAYKKLNLKARHNNDIRLTTQQKQVYQNILRKRQAAEQQQLEYDQRTFTHLVSCTSLENLNKSTTVLIGSQGSYSSRNAITSSSKFRFSTPEVFMRKQAELTKFQPYFNFDQTPSIVNLYSSKSTQVIQSSSQITSSNISSQKLNKQTVFDTQTPSPLYRSSQQNISTHALAPSKSEQLFNRKDNIKIKKCDDNTTSTLNTQEKETNISYHEIPIETPRQKVAKLIPQQKAVYPLQNSYYNNFNNPYQRVIYQIRKKKIFEEKIKDLIETKKSQTSSNFFF